MGRNHSHGISLPKKSSRLAPHSIFKLFLAISIVVVFTATIYKLSDYFIQNSFPTLPKLTITLSDVTIEKIDTDSKEIKYPGNSANLIFNKQSTLYSDVEIKGRGNSTWTQAKKPYQIKFNQKEALFGYAPAKKWILLSNSLDASHLRNDVAFKIAHYFNNSFSPKGQFIELTIDDSYRGLYYLTEKIEIDKNRINLTNSNGFLAELNLYNGEGDDFIFTEDGIIVFIKDTVNSDNLALAKSDLVNIIDEIKQIASSKDYQKLKQTIDVDSFAAHFLVNEFSANTEAYISNFYFYKDGEDDLLHIGPSWDFDLAFRDTYPKLLPGNHISLSNNPEEDRQNSVFPIIYDLLDIPEFSARIKEIYQETMSGKKEELLTYIKNQAAYIRDAALRDEERWKLKTNFDDEVNYLLDWVSKRYDHFEEVYGTDSETNDEFKQPVIYDPTDNKPQEILTLAPTPESPQP